MSEPTNASPDGVRSGELDLDAMLTRAELDRSHVGDIPALVAEVRRLRALVEQAPKVCLTQRAGLPTECQVTIGDRVVFSGQTFFP